MKRTLSVLLSSLLLLSSALAEEGPVFSLGTGTDLSLATTAVEEGAEETPFPEESAETPAPTPEETAAEPSFAPEGTPAPTEALLATETPTAEPAAEEAAPAFSFTVLKLAPSAQEAAVGTPVTLELKLTAGSDGTLPDFGVRFDRAISGEETSQGVQFDGHTLWVRGAQASGGRISVFGQEVHFSFTVVPFESAEDGEECRIGFIVVDGNGARQDIVLGGQVRNHVTLTRSAADAVQEEQTEVGSNAVGEAPAQTEAVRIATSTDAEPLPTDAAEAPKEQTLVGNMPAEKAAAPVLDLRLACDKAAEDIRLGDSITLTALPGGIGDLPYTLQWQENIGGEWVVLPGETAATLTVLVTPDNAQHAWRYDLTIGE